MTRKRSRHSQGAHTLPPRRFFRTRVEVAELVRTGDLSHLDACALIWLHMFDWQGTGTAHVQVKELARWLNVKRETASRALRRLADLGLIEPHRGPGIHLRLLARDRHGSPPHPLGGGGLENPDMGEMRAIGDRETPNLAREEISPPPLSSLEVKAPPRDSSVTRGAVRVTPESHDEDAPVPPALATACALIGVETPEGVRALAQLGAGPRHLLHWHSTRKDRGSHVGSMVRLARKSPDLARRRLETLSLPFPWVGPDVCPLCGASWTVQGRGTDTCPECGTHLRECIECNELAPADAPCPYCGAGGTSDDALAPTCEEAPMPAPDDGVWSEAQALLRTRLGRREYMTYVEEVRLLEQEEEFILLGVPNGLVKNWLRTRLDETIREVLAQVLGVAPEDLDVHYVLDAENV